MMRTIRIIAGAGLLAAASFVSPGPRVEARPGTVPTTNDAGDNEVHTITLPQVQPDLPPGRGRDSVNAACVICHSTRYITIQPRFPRATWTAEVEKMRKTYGAPVSDAQAKDFVEYLVSIRGAVGPTTRP